MTWIPLSPSRRVLVDMLRYAHSIPSIPIARRMNLGDVARVRLATPHPPSWSCLFLRAYGLVCARFNELRRCWVSWPRTRLYEHPYSIGAVAVERDCDGCPELFSGAVRAPETLDLETIQARLNHLKHTDLKDLKGFQRQILLGQIPGFLRRLWLWSKLEWSGKKRVKYAGTFCLTNYGMLGAESLHPLCVQSTVMTLSPLEADGSMTVKLVYDHRVLNGGYVARALDYLEEVLHRQVRSEIESPAMRRSAGALAAQSQEESYHVWRGIHRSF